MYKVYGPERAYAITTDERGVVLKRTEIPPPVAAAVLATVAEQHHQTLYNLGIAAKNDNGKGPKKTVW